MRHIIIRQYSAPMLKPTASCVCSKYTLLLVLTLAHCTPWWCYNFTEACLSSVLTTSCVSGVVHLFGTKQNSPDQSARRGTNWTAADASDSRNLITPPTDGDADPKCTQQLPFVTTTCSAFRLPWPDLYQSIVGNVREYVSFVYWLSSAYVIESMNLSSNI